MKSLNHLMNTCYSLPLYTINAGFPSPADDYLENRLNLNTQFIHHPSATFFVRVAGNSMIGAGIHDQDILVVDRSLTPTHGKIIIAALHGELTVKRLYQKEGATILMSENVAFSPITQTSSLQIWGVVTTVIHSV